MHLDPTVEDVKKLAVSCRRTAKVGEGVGGWVGGVGVGWVWGGWGALLGGAEGVRRPLAGWCVGWCVGRGPRRGPSR
jgi:hypothetical protein